MNRLLAGARHAAGTAVGWAFETLGGPPPGLVPGRPDAGTDDRPVLAVLLLQAAPEAVEAIAAELAAALAAGGPRPILVLDGPHFAIARRAGVTADHVLSRADWERRYPGRSWDAYLDGERDRLRRDFGARVVTLPPGGGLPAGALRAAPDARRWQRVAALAERRIDRGSGG